jgi:hypothetical protein
LSIKDKQALNKIGINDARELLAYFITLNPMRFLQIKKHAPRLAEIYSQAKAVKENGWKFSLAEWINEVPENIEDFYK